MLVALVTQFQIYCRELHDETVALYTSGLETRRASVLARALTLRRHLDERNPHLAALDNDFGRMGIALGNALRRHSEDAGRDLACLETLIKFRNAIVHGSEERIAAMSSTEEISATLPSYLHYKSALERLAEDIDTVVATEVSRTLGMHHAPWG